MTVNDGLGRMWKEAVVICFRVLSYDIARETEEDHVNLVTIACIQTEIVSRGLRKT